jgi:hypothetical protein
MTGLLPYDPTDLFTISAAGGMLQPSLGKLNAVNWLTDMRRASPVYRRRVFTSPTFIKHDGVIMYPRLEIQRLIYELSVYPRRLPSMPAGVSIPPAGHP